MTERKVFSLIPRSAFKKWQERPANLVDELEVATRREARKKGIVPTATGDFDSQVCKTGTVIAFRPKQIE